MYILCQNNICACNIYVLWLVPIFVSESCSTWKYFTFQDIDTQKLEKYSEYSWTQFQESFFREL